jgi:hypothetical protein
MLVHVGLESIANAHGSWYLTKVHPPSHGCTKGFLIEILAYKVYIREGCCSTCYIVLSNYYGWETDVGWRLV